MKAMLHDLANGFNTSAEMPRRDFRAARRGLCLILVSSFCLRSGGIAAAEQVSAPSLSCDAQSSAATAPTQTAVLPLGEGLAPDMSQRAGDYVTYAFDADEGRSYLIEVVQRGLDFIVTVESPDGRRRSFDSPLGRDERELVLLENARPGPYRIIVHSDENTGAVGTQRIRLQSIGDEVDPVMLAIWRLLSDAAEWNHTGGAERWMQARATYETAAELAKSSGDRRLQAYALYAVAMLDYWHLNDVPQAVGSSEQVAELYGGLDEPLLAASALYLEAAALIDSAEDSSDPNTAFARALELLGRAAATQSEFGQTYALAQTLNNTGLAYYRMGDWENARSYWAQALPKFRALDESSGELLPMGNLGAVDFEEGRLTEAAEAFQRVLDLQAPGKDLRQRVDFLSNLASVERILGNFDEALRDFSCARGLAEGIDYLEGLGWALAGLGETYYGIGEYELAGTYLRAALPKEQQAGDARGSTAVLRHLGNIEQLNGDFAAALDFHEQGLAYTTSPQDRALAQLDVARDLSALMRQQEAIDLASDSLSVAEETGSKLLIGDAHETLGRVFLGAERLDEAMTAFKSARDVYASVGMEVEQARALNGLALTTRELGRLQQAAEYAEASLQYVEGVRGRVADPELRAFYLSARREYLELQIDLLMQLHSKADTTSAEYLMAALTTSERSRARLTLDLVQERGVDLGGADADIEERQDELYRELAERRYQRDALAQSSPAALERNAASLSAVLADLAAIENELNLLETDARSSHSPTVSQPLDAREMQAALGNGTVLIQYALGSEKSYAWVVTHDAVHAVQLPGRAAIDGAAREVFNDLKHAQLSDPSAREAQARRDRLADLIVVPIQEFLDRPLVLIAADGALQYVPFTTLSTRSPDGSRSLLVDDHEIVDVSSLSAVVRQRQARRGREPAKEIAVFADPVFEATDVRLAGIQGIGGAGAQAADVGALADLRSNIPLDRLPLTAEEAQAISTFVPANQRLIALGFEASRAAILSADLSDYRILHLATHGVIDTRYPDLSALVFSQFDATGTPRDGFLELHDIFGLDLNADLVVLSACETALGREVRAEGLLGLTQGFMYAGARSLVVALWPVSDRATAELMKAFYDYMLNEGMRPAEALRLAQLSIAAQRRWRDPYYWAGFTLVGDWG